MEERGIEGSRRKLDRAEEQFPDGAGGRYRNPGARKRPGAGDTRAIDLDIRRSDADRKDGCECGGITANILPAADGHDLAPAQPPLERWSESVHGEESALRRDLELLPEGSCATGSAEERQREQGQERRGRREADD